MYDHQQKKKKKNRGGGLFLKAASKKKKTDKETNKEKGNQRCKEGCDDDLTASKDTTMNKVHGMTKEKHKELTVP